MNPTKPTQGRIVYTVGHSNHTMEKFLGLLQQHAIHRVVDVRSTPYSRPVPHFNKKLLSDELATHRIEYVYLGDKLGGRPASSEFYDEAGLVQYARLALSEPFQEGMTLLMNSIGSHRMTLLCGEENPVKCHRHKLVGSELRKQGVTVLHLRGDGTVEDEVELVGREHASDDHVQLNLFKEG
jgi:uncharacterized protein (DUF488 family)